MSEASAVVYIKSLDNFWINGNLNEFNTIFSPHVTGTINTESVGADAILDRLTFIRKNHSDRQMNTKKIFKNDDFIISFGEYHAKDLETGKFFFIPIARYFKVKDSKIIEFNSVTNYDSLTEILIDESED